MSEQKRVLLLGGTGAMGRYLAPELAARGYTVLITSRSKHVSDDPAITYLKGNAKKKPFFRKLMRERYDAIVDFLIYNTESFAARRDALLSHTDHYLFLSSYRVYADAGLTPLTEESPRLLETVQDPEYLRTDEYALTKARQEDLLRASGRRNYTIIRPAITYSYGRFQLGNLEAHAFLRKITYGEPVLFPEEILDKQTTMTWAGDVAKMIASLVLNEAAFGETYTAATSEHHSWREILGYYRERVDLDLMPIPAEEYIERVRHPWQIRYDRLFDRVVDNRKILRATGLEQSDLTPLKDGLLAEFTRFLNDPEAVKELIKIKKSPVRRLIDCIKRGDLLQAIGRRLCKKES